MTGAYGLYLENASLILVLSIIGGTCIVCTGAVLGEDND